MRVVGLDLSLTSTGMSDGRTTDVVQTSPDEVLEARLDRIVRGVMSFVLSNLHRPVADLAVIEGASYGSKGSGVEQLSALRLMVRHRLWRMGVPFALVAPATLKAYTTGNGRASKQDMVAAVAARYEHDFSVCKVKDGRYDMADAFALAAMGHDHAGQPLHRSPGASWPGRQSLDVVKWPDLYGD
jgi:Holliday junction resolvasome RuvABC endonuclease subunit